MNQVYTGGHARRVDRSALTGASAPGRKYHPPRWARWYYTDSFYSARSR